MTQMTLQELLDEINIGYACRALLGGGKGASVMEQIRQQDSAYFERIMAEAKKRVESEVADGQFS